MIGYLVLTIVAMYATRTDAEPVLKCCQSGVGPIVADTDSLCKFHQCGNGQYYEMTCGNGSALAADFVSGNGACNVVSTECVRATPLTVQDNCAAPTDAPATYNCYSCEHNLDGSESPCGNLANATQAALVGTIACTESCSIRYNSQRTRIYRGCSDGWWGLDTTASCEVVGGNTWEYCTEDLCNTAKDPCPASEPAAN